MNSRGLGRGLGALIPEGAPPDARIPATEVDIERVAPNPWQPRTVMDDESLAELADSIREHGIIQPLLVSVEQGADGQQVYQLIAGERRLRAALAAPPAPSSSPRCRSTITGASRESRVGSAKR